MEEEFAALNFVKNNPFFKKDAEKRMSASFCGSLSLVAETVVLQENSHRRRPLSNGFRGPGFGSRSRSTYSVAEAEAHQHEATMVIEGTTVKLRRSDSTRKKDMALRRETVEILMEEIVRENRKSDAEVLAEERAASSGSDIEYGPGIVERLKAKFAKISTGEKKKRQNHKRHHSVDDILDDGPMEYGSYDRRQGGGGRQLSVMPERTTQTLDRSPRHSNGADQQLSRRASRSMADLGMDDYGERRAFSLQRPSRREEFEREQEERLAYRLSIEEDDMVDIRELRKMFDRPAAGGAAAAAAAAPAPWRMTAGRDRFIERGRTHQTVPPNLGDSRRDAPPPRDLRLSSATAPITIDRRDEEEEYTRAVPLKKTLRRVSEEARPVFDEASNNDSVPEFVRMARRLRRATIEAKTREEEVAQEGAAPPPLPPLAIVTSLPPADPCPPSSDTHLVSPPTGRRDSFTGAAADVSPPPEEPKPPMRRLSESDSTAPPPSSACSDVDSRYSSLARSEKSERSSRSESITHLPFSDLSLPRSDHSGASKVSKRSVSTDGGVRMGYCRSTSSERRTNTYAKIVPENQGTSGVEEMQRLLSRFSSRKPREEEEQEEERKEAPSTRDEFLPSREARREEKTEGEEKEERLPRPTTVVLSPTVERRSVSTAGRFVPAIIGIRSSDGRQLLSPTKTTAPPTIAAELLQTAAPAANVVSISVRDSAPSVIYTNNKAMGQEGGEVQQLQQGQSQQLQHHHRQIPCDEEDSDTRRSSVGSTASSSSSSSVHSVAESMTSSGCSSSEDLAEERPRSLLPPTTPPRKESLESSSPRKSLSARYLEERGREYTVAPPTPEDDTLMMMEKSEMSFDRISAFSAAKPYGDEACTPPAAVAAPVASATWPTAAAAKVEEEEAEHEAAAASAAAAESACCMTQNSHQQQQEEDTESAPTTTATNDDELVSVVEIDEEEIIEESEEEEDTPEVRQQPDQHVDVDVEEEGEERQPTPDVRQQPDSDSEIDTDDDGEIEDIASRHLRLSFAEMCSPLLAGDGNPIRQSIIHLAMEEDRPALLEAMSETYSFVFEDLDATRASTSTAGIISAPNKERRAKMKRINFAAEVAGVYTYLDEQSAETEEHWRDGAAVTIETYHSMVAAAAAEAEADYMRSMDELARWKASIAASENASSSSSTQSGEPLADLTSRHLVYST